MNKFKVGQRVKSPMFGEGVVKALDRGGALCVEFDVIGSDLHDCDGACKDRYGWFYDPDTCESKKNPEDHLTPIGPYEGERVAHAEFGDGTIVETETGFGGRLILVQFGKVNDRRLHDGSVYCRGTYLSGTCLYFTSSNYGKTIKPLTAPEPQPAPATVADVESLIAAHVEEYHKPAKPAAPVIPEAAVPGGWNSGHPDDENMDNVEILFADGTMSVGFFGTGTERWHEFEQEYRIKALADRKYGPNDHYCQKPVIGWRVPQPEPEPFKRGERVVMYGEQVTFVAYENDICVIVMLDDGNESGWPADFRHGSYGSFLYTNPKNLKR